MKNEEIIESKQIFSSAKNNMNFNIRLNILKPTQPSPLHKTINFLNQQKSFSNQYQYFSIQEW